MYSTHLGTYMAHINLYFCCLKDIYLPINFPFDERFDLILDLMSADFDVVAPSDQLSNIRHNQWPFF